MTTPPLVPPFGGQPPAPPQQQQQQAQAARDVNTASLCRIGQETVQDIVIRTMEIFQLLRNMQVGPCPLHLSPAAGLWSFYYFLKKPPGLLLNIFHSANLNKVQSVGVEQILFPSCLKLPPQINASA